VTQRRTREEFFDGKKLSSQQISNEGARPLDLHAAATTDSSLRCMTDELSLKGAPLVKQPAFEYLSLDDLFGKPFGFSATFNSDAAFRKALRQAIRQDIFDATPFYQNLLPKAAACLMLPDSSLEGSWRKPADVEGARMKHTTSLLQETFGSAAPTGDELMSAVGALCGSKPSTHWIDIYGVQD
jgi:hypothetical protein